MSSITVDELKQQLETARVAHRHAAHVYARTKRDSDKYEVAVEALEKAATVFVLAAAAYGAARARVIE